FVSIFLLIFAVFAFAVRGPLRFAGARDFNDFISPYIQSRAFLMGLDPYSPEVLVRLWPAHHFNFLDKDLAEGSLVINHGIPTAYPITCLLFLVPFALLPWPVAHALWLVLNLVLVVGLICAFCAALFEPADWRRYVFAA